jgi:hypothetical protein
MINITSCNKGPQKTEQNVYINLKGSCQILPGSLNTVYKQTIYSFETQKICQKDALTDRQRS